MTPCRLQLASLLVTLLTCWSFLAADQPATKPIELGSRRELFVDSFLIDRMNGVTLSPENAVKIKAMKDGGLKIGEKVAYGVKRGREITTRDVALEKIPEAVLTSLINRHSQEEHEVARNR